ncbi:MAG: hypothetical protein ACYTEZ_14950 [Planctomycetota bacterium]|jgi:hypothetical protein
MWKRLAIVALGAALIGCSGSDVITFDMQALVDSFETSVETQQLMSEYVFAAARGELDISGAEYTYVPPSGQTPGTLTITNGTYPFGSGDLVINFTAEGDSGFVDPYLDDLSDDAAVTVVADVVFNGTGTAGEDLDAVADFVATTVQNEIDTATTTVNGAFGVAVDEYNVDFVTSDVEMTFDLVNETVTNVSGVVDGTMDIPNFAPDADFSVTGLGDQLDIAIDAVAAQINYTIDLIDL